MRIVQKFGGTSVAGLERIRKVAERVKKWADCSHQVAVVVSAMAGETNRLLNLSREMSNSPSQREKDVLVATGEQVSMALLAIALQKMGVVACSFTGWQAGLKTDEVYGKARIQKFDASRVIQSLEQGKVVIMAGFQGINELGDITTLGRGGSDTSAVALAAAVQADECQIYTDVDGIYTTDPRIVPEASQLRIITYEEILEMASSGAKVLQIRAAELAYKKNVPMRILSSLLPCTDESLANLGGTLIVPDAESAKNYQTTNKIEVINSMEARMISGIAFSRGEAQIRIKKVKDSPGIAFSLLVHISKANIEVDMIVQNTSDEGYTDFTFTVHRNDFKRALEIAREKAKEIGTEDVVGDDTIVKVSLVGVGMRSQVGIATEMFRCLGEAGINILIISTSEIKISVCIKEESLEKAVQVLHDAFDLDKVD